MNIYQTVLSEKKVLTTDQLLLKFSLIKPEEINFTAGQYIMLKIEEKNRLYSIFSSESSKKEIELMIHLIPGGLASSYLSSLNIGDKITLWGPAGAFYLRQNQKNKVFFATYTGLAPLWSMVKTHFEKNPEDQTGFTLYWGLKNEKDICFLEELKSFSSAHPNFQFTICLSQEQTLEKIPPSDQKYFRFGRINIACNNPDKESEYYICGSREVVKDICQFLLEKGIPSENIFFEKF